MNDTAAPAAPVLSAPAILVMGVGSSGTRAVATMLKARADLNALAVDTDKKVLESVDPKLALHVGESVTRGFSAGGDVELGRQSVEKDSSGIRTRLRNADLLVIVAGLGGGTGSGAVPVITRIAREAGTLVLALVSMPFTFEGKKAAKIAEESLKRIRTHADAIIRVSNERLITRADADLPVEQAFTRGHQVMSDGIFALCRLLHTDGICGLDFACIHTMLRNCDGFCHLAVVEATGAGRSDQVAEALLNHPLLGKGKMLQGAAGIIVGVTGGPDLKMSELESVINRIQERVQEEEVWLNFGVVVEPDFGNRLCVMVLAAEQWKEPLVDSAGRQMGFRFNPRRNAVQGELMLESIGKGEFAYVDPTIHNNQDLDVPAYIRRDIKLPR